MSLPLTTQNPKCECCQWEAPELKLTEVHHVEDTKSNLRLCDVCVGMGMSEPIYMRPNAALMRAIGWSTNCILQAIADKSTGGSCELAPRS